MKWKILMLLILSLSLSSFILAKDPVWLEKIKNVKPLFSSREDVIKLLGEPVDKSKISYITYYDLSEGRLSVLYSTGICPINIENGIELLDNWNISEWTVIEVNFTPNRRIVPKKLGVNFVNLKVSQIGDLLDAFIYENDELGIDYTVYKGKIEDITFRPAKKYDYMQCK